MGLAVEYRPVADLIPYARNARIHSDAQIAQIAASIREFGWTNPILVDGTNGIIAGHGRVLAARKLGIDPVPCIELAGLSEAQRRAYILQDNKSALNAGWDEALLRVELADLRDMAFDLSLTGFGEDELGGLVNAESGTGSSLGEGRGSGSLAARFGVPPFSVLNAREGWWQERKAAWIALGIKSELGRGNENLAMSHPATTATIDYYAQKRALEAEIGRALGTDEAKSIMAARGTLKDERAGNAKRKADAIPGGAGKNAACAKGGRISPAQAL